MDILISEIKVGQRFRQPDTAKIESLAESIKQVGLIQPITIDNDFNLLSGLHRLRAHELLGLDSIAANMRDVDEVTAELIEIDENLHRNNLTPLEEGEHLIRRDELLIKLGMRAPSHRPEKGADSASLITTSDIADSMGVSKRTMKERRQIARDIVPEVKEIIKGTDFEYRKTDLLKLSRMEPEKQKEVGQVVRKIGGAITLLDATIQMSSHDLVNPRPHVSHNSGENEWYTPSNYIEAARNVMGSIDLDPASSIEANKTVKARHFFTSEDNGLSKRWGGNVWLNPPYSSDLIRDFCKKTIESIDHKDISQMIVLVNNATETGWFQSLMDIFDFICFVDKRIRFTRPNGETGAPLQGQAILYYGDNYIRFIDYFKQFGRILQVMDHD